MRDAVYLEFSVVRAACREVAGRYGLDAQQIRVSKVAIYAQARQEAYLLLREQGYSLPTIGRAFGRDHSSILHGCRQALRRRGEAA